MQPTTRELLRRARIEFLTLGVIKADTAAKLMSHGYIVPDLVERWMQNMQWAT